MGIIIQMETPLRPIIRVKMGKTTSILTNKCFFSRFKESVYIGKNEVPSVCLSLGLSMERFLF